MKLPAFALKIYREINQNSFGSSIFGGIQILRKEIEVHVTGKENYSTNLKKLVLDWQAAVYSFSRRMTGNDVDAADLTQEVFAGIFKNPAMLDSVEDMGPWILQVTANRGLQQFRQQQRRFEREKVAGMAMTRETQQDGWGENLEQKEIQNLIQQELRHLDEESRACVLLHYYHGIPQSKVAEMLGMPRSTLQSRLDASLYQIKKALAPVTLLAGIPALELCMKNSGTLSVPHALSRSLTTLAGAASGTAAGSVAGTLIGGVVMTKKIVAAVTLVALLSMTTGFGIGHITKNQPENQFQAPENKHDAKEKSALNEVMLSKAEYEALKKRTEDAETFSAKISSLTAENQRLGALIKNSDGDMSELKKTVASLQNELQSLKGKPGETDEDKFLASVDWEIMRKIFEIRQTEITPENAAETEKLQAKAAREFFKIVAYYEMESNNPSFFKHGKLLAKLFEVCTPEGKLKEKDRDLIMNFSKEMEEKNRVLDKNNDLTWIQKKAALHYAALSKVEELLENFSAEIINPTAIDMLAQLSISKNMRGCSDRKQAEAALLEDLKDDLKLSDSQIRRFQNAASIYFDDQAKFGNEIKRKFSQEILELTNSNKKPSSNPEWTPKQNCEFSLCKVWKSYYELQAQANLHESIKGDLEEEQLQRLKIERSLKLYEYQSK